METKQKQERMNESFSLGKDTSEIARQQNLSYSRFTCCLCLTNNLMKNIL